MVELLLGTRETSDMTTSTAVTFTHETRGDINLVATRLRSPDDQYTLCLESSVIGGWFPSLELTPNPEPGEDGYKLMQYADRATDPALRYAVFKTYMPVPPQKSFCEVTVSPDLPAHASADAS